MKRRSLIVSGVVIGIILLTQSSVANALLGLILTGSIPGTTVSIPFWLMMTIYSAISALLIAWYIESLIVSHRMRKSSARQRMPRRRYSHI